MIDLQNKFKSDIELSNHLCRKYFNIWKESLKIKNEKINLPENITDQQTKLDKLIKKLKKCKKQEKPKCGKQKELREMLTPSKPSNNYKNRFVVQKGIIDMQRAKLIEQNRVIEELRLGIIREDLIKSVHDLKINIREIFSSCSERTKCKIPIVVVEEKEKFIIRAQKAPKLIQEMEQRALQRQERMEIILERKRIIEETRQKLLVEAIERKRAIEEEETKKSLELMKKNRKRELEQKKIREALKQKYLSSLGKAICFYNKMLIKNCFKKMYSNFRKCKENKMLAKKHNEMKILYKTISCWCDLVEKKHKVKYEIADVHFGHRILERIFTIWRNVIYCSFTRITCFNYFYIFSILNYCFSFILKLNEICKWLRTFTTFI